MNSIENIKELISQGSVDMAIEQANLLLQQVADAENAMLPQDYLYYLRGNAYRKKGDWKGALDSYQYAIDLNPESPAAQARRMVIDILEFYNKDMYNQ